MDDTMARLCDVFQDVFDDDELTINRETTAADIEEWDSLMQVNIVLGAEREFSVRFSSSEVANLVNVGELVDLIEHKSSSTPA